VPLYFPNATELLKLSDSWFTPLSVLTWFISTRRAVVSDPAPNDTKTMPQTVHHLNFQRLSVMAKAARSMNDRRCMLLLLQVNESGAGIGSDI